MKVGVFCMDNIERMWAAYNLDEVGGGCGGGTDY
jgi:hypothetical protein